MLADRKQMLPVPCGEDVCAGCGGAGQDRVVRRIAGDPLDRCGSREQIGSEAAEQIDRFAGAWCVEPELLREYKFRKEKVAPTVDRLLEQPVRRPVGDQRRDENVRVADDPILQALRPRTSSTHASPSSGPIPRSSARSRAYR